MVVPIGLEGEFGSLAAGSQEPGFPDDEHRVLLNSLREPGGTGAPASLRRARGAQAEYKRIEEAMRKKRRNDSAAISSSD